MDGRCEREIRGPAQGAARARVLIAGTLLTAGPVDLWAGAWLMPPGTGQIIAGAAFSGSTRAFDAHGRLIPVPSYEKFELGAYLEYGLADQVTLVAAPAYDRIRQPWPAHSYQGLGESGLGARFGVYQGNGLVVSVQGMGATPGASFDGGGQPQRSASFELRGLAGYGFVLNGGAVFVDAEAAYRFYTRLQPGEWRLDLTVGVRPSPQLAIMLQSFGSMQTENSQSFPRSSWHKLQWSFVYDLTPEWSVQCGAFLTLAGVNAGRELGPIAAVWRKF